MPKTKPIIAVDIDDVLADNAGGFIAFSNKRWGTHLTVDDYDEHWGKMWQLDKAEEIEQRAIEFHASGIIGMYKHVAEAKPVLLKLSHRYKLVIVTSRRSVVTEETHAWLDSYFKDIFADIYFAGFYDNQRLGFHHTKAELCKEIGVSYLIDDQLKHCLAAAAIGIETLLFGNYKWNQTDKPLHKGVTRVDDWNEIADYFKAKGGGR